MFPVELFGVKINPANCVQNIYIWRSYFYHIRDLQCIHLHLDKVTLIVQIYLQVLLCLAALNIAIHICQAFPTLTSPIFNVFKIDWPAL